MPDSYAQLYVHLVWAKWDRVPSLIGATQAAAYAGIRAELAELNVLVLAIGGIADHVHLLIKLPRTLTIAHIMKQVKGSSAHLVNHRPEDPDYIKWQKGYGAFTISKSHVPKVIGYIQRQEQHHHEGKLSKDLEMIWEEKPTHPALDADE